VSDPTLFWSLSLIPVQQWISEARRSRDLLVGSGLLAWTVAEVLRRLKVAGARIVVPDPRLVERAPEGGWREWLERGTYSLPNRASGTAQGKAVATVEALLPKLEEEVVLPAWEEVARGVEASKPFPRSNSPAWREIRPFLGEVPCPFHLVQCARRLDGASVKEGLKSIDEVLRAVKRHRPISSHEGSPVGKCQQCGRREAMGPPTWNEWRAYHEELADLEEIALGHRLDANERLCPTCTVKRLAGYLPEGISAPSTSEVAAKEWLYRVRQREDLQPLLEAMKRAAREVPGFGDDPAPLYFQRTRRRLQRATAVSEVPGSAGSVRASREVKDVHAKQAAAVAQVDALAEELAGAIREQRPPSGEASDARPVLPPEPSNYLAVVTFDGDDMGRRVQEDPEGMPRRLAIFAEGLEGTVESHRAHPFYLGGDEGLILCPVERALELAIAIRERWMESVGSSGDGRPATLSAGVCIFDRERPLGGAIQGAHEAIERAKGMEGKDALAVRVQTASGSSWTALDHWDGSWEHLEAAVRLVREGKLVSGWAYDVEELLRSLSLEVWRTEPGVAAVRDEVRRLTARRAVGRPRPQVAEEVWRRLRGDAWWGKAPQDEARAKVADGLHLVGFLARHAGIGVDDEDSREAA